KRAHGDRSAPPIIVEIRLGMMAARHVARGISDTEAARDCADLWDEDESTWHKVRRANKARYERMVGSMREGHAPTDLYLPKGEKDNSSSS
ncbi:MAG: hypothetical protein WBG92_05065, partial [Thiohalocapsa sp.]